MLGARWFGATFAALSLLAACNTDPDASLDASAGEGPNDAGEVDSDASAPGDGDGEHDGGPVKPDPFDTSVLTFAEGTLPCTLSADRREFLVEVKNDGSETTPAIPVAVRTANTVYSGVVPTPELAPGESATLHFDRAPLAGFVGDWAFELVVDPDASYGPAGAPHTGSCADLRTRTLEAMPVLYGWYDSPSGLFNGAPPGPGEWWTGANMVEVSIDHARETGDARYLDVITRSFDQAAKSYPYADDNFLNEYLDDQGWWALAWIKAYDFTHEAKYLDLAKLIFDDMTHYWSDVCGGGILWNKNQKYKSSISNELFLTVAARLHLRTPGDTSYLDWAQREWNWFAQNGVIQDSGQIMDGVNGDTCQAGGPAYTYNQGVILGGLTELWRATGEQSVLDAAEKIADGALAHMTNADGVFIEAVCDPTCDADGDGVQFKGVFTRNLIALYEALPKEAYRSFLIRQSDALWNDDRSMNNELGLYWQGPFDKATASRQSTAMDALVAAVRAANMNLALRGAAQGSAPCSANEGVARAIDGNSGPGSKWCTGDLANAFLEIDLGAARQVVGFRVRHAGAGGENSAWNTRDFEIETSSDGTSWTPTVSVTGNTDDVTTHLIPAIETRHVRLHITTAQTATDFVAVRIYELEVFGVGL
jgi:predicted alpha-1,6-mannanase (GH76 family)